MVKFKKLQTMGFRKCKDLKHNYLHIYIDEGIFVDGINIYEEANFKN